jgi:hypothetical protein
LKRRDEVKERVGNGNGMGMPLSIAVQLLPTPTSRDHKGRNQRDDETCLAGALLPTPNAADGARGQDFARANREGSGGDDLVTLAVKADRDSQWGKYEPAIRRWENLTRPAPSPTEPNSKGNPRLSPAFSEWMMGWPAGHVTQVPGISRNDQLRIVGNGVVPQQAAAALRWLLGQIGETYEIGGHPASLIGREVDADPGVPGRGAVQPDRDAGAFDELGVDGASGVSGGDEGSVSVGVLGFHAGQHRSTFGRHQANRGTDTAHAEIGAHEPTQAQSSGASA